MKMRDHCAKGCENFELDTAKPGENKTAYSCLKVIPPAQHYILCREDQHLRPIHATSNEKKRREKGLYIE